MPLVLKQLRLLATLTVAVVLLGAACGDSGKKKEAKGTVSSECKAPGVSFTGVNVGVLSSQSGAESGDQFRPFHLGVVARFAAENAGSSGIDGRGLSAEIADDGGTAALNRTLAKELIEAKQVYGIIEASPSASGSAKYLHDKGVPVTGVAITPEWGKYDNMFGYGGSADPAADWKTLDPDLPEYREFKDWLSRTVEGEHPGQMALAGWLSADVFIRGLHEAGVECPARKDFIANLRKVVD